VNAPHRSPPPSEWFSSPLLVVLFVSYACLVTILLLNILIAVVSDSYEYAQIRSRVLFRRARLELAAELEALTPLFSWFNRGAYRALAEETERPTVISRFVNWAHVWEWVKDQLRLSTETDAADGAAGADSAADEDALWKGRALDAERRVQRLVAASEARIVAHIEQALAEHSRR